ncbi:thioredoxin domain-containing protein [Pricia sp. S334]|uniref:Thioredoxin domain-containing protein n=1 Tax=Pricia mediterranea TaxID=3076079 RepID=A0ABU3L846_9FLAO|nr:thioredoxin domain-containing protein [Pricia sp. S334]MDT7829543.1 thioredoxin domain-containing protein [Pricia sp. S334]
MEPEFTNALIDETSPYLLQHAHNPVDWEAWHPEVLARAEKENKLLLISIGYAACHWCHVMERECFEDSEVARTMNENFINIKVDREERPDVDHIYMDALQMMTGQGGWPLNIAALPDGRPFWGATYVKKENWTQVLQQLSDLYRDDPAKVEGYAQKLADGIKAINLVELADAPDSFDSAEMEAAVAGWSRYFDNEMGGYNRAPKFMLPVNLNFLLHYGTARKDGPIMDYVNTSLTKMAWGGVFDQVGGGFSRYSVDTKWHVPHFEKMLYDNGQLVSLYAQAYAETGNDLFRETVEKTIAFVQRELMSEDFGLYSSLDADSQTENGALEEGAFYVWREDELQQLLGSRFAIFKEVYNINDYGHWENGNFVLIRNASREKIAEKHAIDLEELKETMEECLKILYTERQKRDRPRLDDKILTSWNGLMLKGLTDAYRYLQNPDYLDLALKNADFILKNMGTPDGGLFHNHKNGKSSINGYLEDYASVIDAYIGLYETTYDINWLKRAKSLVEYCQAHFHDPRSGMFFFTSDTDDFVIRRTIETVDNVIPASNSIMAKNLFKLSRFFPEYDYASSAMQLLKNMQENFEKSAQNHANWLDLALYFQRPFYEIAIVGDRYGEKAKSIGSQYLPNSILAASDKQEGIALFRDRYVEGQTLFHVCEEGACQRPTARLEEVLAQIRFDSRP